MKSFIILGGVTVVRLKASHTVIAGGMWEVYMNCIYRNDWTTATSRLTVKGNPMFHQMEKKNE